MTDIWIRTLTALGIGAAGATMAHVVGAPAALLTGPALAVSLAAFAGVRLALPARLRDVAFVVLGVGMGTGVTPASVEAVVAWPVSFAILAVAVTAILVFGALSVHGVTGRGRNTSVLAASPGHLSYVLGLSIETRADVGFVTVVQSLRLLALTLVVPLVVGSGTAVGMAQGETLALHHLAALLAGAVVLGLVLMKLRVPAALLLGGMIVSAAGHAGDWTPGVLPSWLALPGFVVLGTLIGTRFDGMDRAALRAAAGVATVLTGFAVGLAAAGAWIVAALTGLPLVTLLIAFAPGGVETMAAMAVALDADPAFVAAHHVFRLLWLTLLIPLSVERGALSRE